MYTYSRPRGAGGSLSIRLNIDPAAAGAVTLYEAPGARVLRVVGDVYVDGVTAGRTALALKQRWSDEIRSTGSHGGSEYETLLMLHAAAAVADPTPRDVGGTALWGLRAAPNIVRTCGQFVSRDGGTCTLLEFAEHGDVQRLLHARAAARRPLPEAVIWHLLHCVLSALAHAHACGFLHRDVKPSNVLMFSRSDDRRGVDDDALVACDFKLADFGVARRVSPANVISGTPHAFASSLYGTPLYMSPEALRAGVDGYGFATDVWSVGVLAYEAAALQHPLRARGVRSIAEMHDAVVTAPFPPLPERYSPALRDLIAACMHVDPGRRPTAAGALASIPVYRVATPSDASTAESASAAPAAPVAATAVTSHDDTPASNASDGSAAIVPHSAVPSPSPAAPQSAGPRVVRVKHKRAAAAAAQDVNVVEETAGPAQGSTIVQCNEAPSPPRPRADIHVVPPSADITPAVTSAAPRRWDAAAAHARRSHRALRSCADLLRDVSHVHAASHAMSDCVIQAAAAVAAADEYLAGVMDDTVADDRVLVLTARLQAALAARSFSNSDEP